MYLPLSTSHLKSYHNLWSILMPKEQDCISRNWNKIGLQQKKYSLDGLSSGIRLSKVLAVIKECKWSAKEMYVVLSAEWYQELMEQSAPFSQRVILQ